MRRIGRLPVLFWSQVHMLYLIIVFALTLKVLIGVGIGFPCWLHFRAHSQGLRW